MKKQRFFDNEHKFKNGIFNTFLIQLFISAVLLLAFLLILHYNPFGIYNIRKNLGNKNGNLEGISKQINELFYKAGDKNEKDSIEKNKSNSFEDEVNSPSPVMSDVENVFENLPDEMPNDLKTFLWDLHFDLTKNIETYPLYENDATATGGSNFNDNNYLNYILSTRNINPQNESLTDKITASFDEYTLPIQGNVTSVFGYREDPFTKLSNFHNGIDIGVKSGTKVYAVLEGTVAKSGFSKTGGYYIYLKHNNGFLSYYGHLQKILKKNGDKVKNGEVIALSGNTGLTTGAHLHFQLIYNGSPIDPTVYMDFYD